MAKQEILKVVIKKDTKDESLNFSINSDGLLGDILYGAMSTLGKIISDIDDEKIRIDAIDSCINDLKGLKEKYENKD